MLVTTLAAGVARRTRSLLQAHPRLSVGVAAVVLGLASGAAAYAMIPAPDGVISGCYDKHGNLRVIDPAQETCDRNETALRWNQSGPIGPRGIPGLTGPAGPGGPTGSQGATGPAGPVGATGAQGVAGMPGIPGPTGATGATGPAGPAGAAGGGVGAENQRVIGVITVDDVILTPKPVRSFRFGVKMTIASGGGGGGGAGKADFDDLTVVRSIDADSPELFATAASGKHIPKVKLEVYQEGTTTVLATYELEDVLVTVDVHSDAGRPGGLPLEEIAFTYGKIKITVGGNSAGWDLKQNKKV